MKTIKFIINMALAMTIGLSTGLNASAQMSDYKFEQQFDKAFQYVLEGEYEEAIPIFRGLERSDSNHGQVQYLYALSIIKSNHPNSKTTELLEKAVKNFDQFHQTGRVEDRTAPAKAWKYLAQSYAATFEFDKAVTAYRNYMSCIPLASIDHKREIVESIKELKQQKLASNSEGVNSLLATRMP